MAFEKTDNSGAIFRNERRDNDKQPTHSGNALIDGKEYWISAWVKDGKKGKFFSLAFKPKDGGSQRPAPRAAEPSRTYAEELDDQIPF